MSPQRPGLAKETAAHLRKAEELAKGDRQNELLCHLTAALCWEMVWMSQTIETGLDDVEGAVNCSG